MIRFVVLIWLTLSICFWSCESKENEESTADSIRQVKPTMGVDGFVVKEVRLESLINATGSLLPNESVKISPERSGKIRSIEFDESSFVEAGTVLAKIDDEELQAQLNKLKVQEKMALRNEERARELVKVDAIPQDEFDQLQNTVEQIQAEIKLTEVQIDKTNIRAPFSGLIGLRHVSLGAYVTPEQSLAELQQVNPLKLEFDVPEKFMRQVNVGQKVSFGIVGFDQPFTATIYATSVEVTPGTRTFKVRAKCGNPGSQLKPGNFAKVDVITGINDHAIMVPSDAVIPVISGKKIFVTKGGQVEERPVETGDRKGEMVEIVSGVSAGDTVIVSGLLALSGGMPVNISELVEFSSHLN